VTIYFLRDICNRKKLRLKNDAIKTLHVPQYKNLTLNHIMDFASNHPKVFDYLPDEPDLPKIPKQWIVDVCAAVIGAEFRDWVDDCKEERNEAMAEKRNMMIDMDPEMAAKFKASTHVSCRFYLF
jgi:hypothetical protein